MVKTNSGASPYLLYSTLSVFGNPMDLQMNRSMICAALSEDEFQLETNF